MRIALVADSHLSPRAPECVRNWEHAARAVAAWHADLTVHLGDITLDGQDNPDEFVFAARLIERWPTPMHCVPGNHDMGTGSGEEPLDRRKLAACEQAFGPGQWIVRAGAWRLIGLNAQLLGTRSAEEETQWQWLDRQAAAEPALPTLLFLHRPVERTSPDERARAGRYVPEPARERLLYGPLKASLRCVFSGHTHQYLDRHAAGMRHVWVPSAAFVLPDAIQSRVGEKLVGIGLLELDGPLMRFHLHCPEGMCRHDAGELAFWAAYRQWTSGTNISAGTGWRM
jgi:3',5'-cyclic AMP phosphodiesterase CpdA